MTQQKELIEEFLRHYMDQMEWPRSQALAKLKESIEYSLFNGGKRFRPTLCLQLAECFGVHPKAILPWAAAVEMIHTYSLIHDDLPSLDNDDLRRGQATNHKIYGDATALLAGDALLTEAFRMIAKSYSDVPVIAVNLTLKLAEAAGMCGMVGGQVMDLASQQDRSLQELNLIHKLKTGALIRVACEGSAVVMGLGEDKQMLVRRFGEQLGLAFQLKDDLLDSVETVEKGSFPDILGAEETQSYLEEVSAVAKSILHELGISQGLLIEIIEFNLNRNK